MRLAVSHSYFNKKLDEFGLGHDEAINRIMEIEKKELERTHPTHSIPACEETINIEVGDSNMSEASKAIYAKRLALIQDAPQSDLEIDFSLPIMKKCFRKSLKELKSLFVFSVGFIWV